VEEKAHVCDLLRARDGSNCLMDRKWTAKLSRSGALFDAPEKTSDFKKLLAHPERFERPTLRFVV
jgi:hypothetical protein